MVNVTVSLSEELKSKMNELDYVNWSAVIRKVIENKVRDLQIAEEIAGKSHFTEKDLLELSEKVDEDARKEARRLLDEVNRGR